MTFCETVPQTFTINMSDVKESRVLQGRLHVSEDRLNAQVAVKTEEIREIIAREYTSIILANLPNQEEYVSVDEVMNFGATSMYSIQVDFWNSES